MGVALLSLPNEVLIGIIEHADSACKRTFLDLRLVSKTLEQLCHERFLRYLELLRVDPSQHHNLTRLMEILSSPTHACAVRGVAFDFVRDWRNVWAVTPLVQQLFDKLSTLDVKLELKFSPYGSNEWISEPCIVHYIAGIVKQVLTSHMSVSRLIVRAKDWDPDLQLDKMLCRLEKLLINQEKEAQAASVESLAVEFTHGGVVYDRQRRCLHFTQVTAHDLQAIGQWIQEKHPTELALAGCQFFVEQLDGIFLPNTPPFSLLTRITINNARLMHLTSFFGASQTATPLHKLLSHILRHSDDLEYLHLENIRVETPHPRTLNFVGENKVHMTSEENIRETLTHLISQLADEDHFEIESQEAEEDEEDDEDEGT
ncbi:unnamed protein product [Aureobasidium vineae]|uniref:F-box domain-containing protein n=1 Tax=Aureobasidium vineae TaxID=2773715 RepID=A0A9N8P9K3_9PEZI|nr:unnamed protein product [Aureobasidium vineae]